MRSAGYPPKPQPGTGWRSVTLRRAAAGIPAAVRAGPQTMAVLDVGSGHTDPQLVIPSGGVVRVDGAARRITVTY
jgi:hypothetical protein